MTKRCVDVDAAAQKTTSQKTLPKRSPWFPAITVTHYFLKLPPIARTAAQEEQRNLKTSNPSTT